MSEHVYSLILNACVALAFKMTEQVEQQIGIKFCFMLEHSSIETIQMIQKGRSYGQLVIGSFITTCPLMPYVLCSFSAKHQITQVTQHPSSLDLVSCDFCFSPKLKSPLKGKRFQTINEIQENMTGQLMVIGRTL